ncbi:hypothetical protein [Streptomyces sp. NPDC057910]|uniref:hypothetical protein n=1 Tax=Streptomyces sp. NPDC057910 TaxID=3346278 RepID=UPI0036E4AC31
MDQNFFRQIKLADEDPMQPAFFGKLFLGLLRGCGSGMDFEFWAHLSPAARHSRISGSTSGMGQPSAMTLYRSDATVQPEPPFPVTELSIPLFGVS